MKLPIICATSLLAVAGPAHAGALLDLKSITSSVNGEYLSYSGPFGSRRVVNAETRINAGKTKAFFGIAQGQRKAGGHTFRATRLTGAVVHQWTGRLSTRTSASLATDKPVFVTRELAQDVSYKVLGGTVLTVGGRYDRYFGQVDALSWSAGAAQYFRGGLVSYRFSAFDVRHVGHSVSHLASVKLKDRLGSSQLWLGHGTALHDADWLPTPERGKYTSVELQRTQRIGGGIGLTAGISRKWYETASVKYRGLGVRLGLTFAR